MRWCVGVKIAEHLAEADSAGGRKREGVWPAGVC
jgi:hypothetical protein